MWSYQLTSCKFRKLNEENDHVNIVTAALVTYLVVATVTEIWSASSCLPFIPRRRIFAANWFAFRFRVLTEGDIFEVSSWDFCSSYSAHEASDHRKGYYAYFFSTAPNQVHVFSLDDAKRIRPGYHRHHFGCPPSDTAPYIIRISELSTSVSLPLMECKWASEGPAVDAAAALELPKEPNLSSTTYSNGMASKFTKKTN